LVITLSMEIAGSHHARAGVGNAQQFERALHRAVFAEAAMQRDEAALEAFALQLDQVALGRVEGMRVDARDCSAFSTPVPDISETSRSADLPPIRTATLPKLGVLKAFTLLRC
jgi:hypothetical protein